MHKSSGAAAERSQGLDELVPHEIVRVTHEQLLEILRQQEQQKLLDDVFQLSYVCVHKRGMHSAL